MCANCGCEYNMLTMINMQTGTATLLVPANGHAGASELHSQHNHKADAHNHDHADHRHHSDHHEHDHSHEWPHRYMHLHGRGGEYWHAGHLVGIETRILAKNDARAARTRAWLSAQGIVALNLASSPGAGKTTLLERTIAALSGELPLFVIEGDQATSNDGERIRGAGAPVVQVNTGTVSQGGWPS